MRNEGWEAILHDHINQARASDFRWGTLDCAMWCAGWILKATGNDLASAWRGQYSDEETLQKLMQREGFSSYEAIADSTPLPAIPVSLAQRGDIMLHPQNCLGICNGISTYFLTDKGFLRFPTLKCLKAWKV
jgi:hypothetical protein